MRLLRSKVPNEVREKEKQMKKDSEKMKRMNDDDSVTGHGGRQ